MVGSSLGFEKDILQMWRGDWEEARGKSERTSGAIGVVHVGDWSGWTEGVTVQTQGSCCAPGLELLHHHLNSWGSYPWTHSKDEEAEVLSR